MKYLGSILLMIALSCGITENSWSQKNKKKKKKKKGKNTTIAKSKVIVEKHDSFLSEKNLINGMKYYILKDYNTAIPFFKTAINADSDNIAAYHQLSKCYEKLDNLEEAEENAKKAIEKDNTNYFYFSHLASIYIGENKWDEASVIYSKIINTFPKRWSDYERLANMYVRQKKYKKAIETYDLLEEKTEVTISLIRRKQQLYIQLNDRAGAMKEAEKLVNTFPDNIKHVLFYTEMLVIDKQYEKAKERLIAFEKEEGKNTDPKVYLLLAEIYDNTQNEEKYMEYMKKSFSSKNLSATKKTIILKKYLVKSSQKQLFDEGKSLSAIAIKIHPENPQINTIYGEYLYLDKKYEASRDYFLIALRKNENDFDTWNKVLSIDHEINDGSSMIAHADQALELYPNQPSFWLYKGKGHNSVQEYEEAIDSFEQGKNLSSDDSLLTQFYEYLGDAFYKVGKKETALQQWKEAISLTKKPSAILKKKVNTGEISD